MADDKNIENNKEKTTKKEILKKNTVWLNEVRKTIERRGYFCIIKNFSGGNNKLMTFDYTIDNKKFKIATVIYLLLGKIITRVDKQEVLNTNIDEYQDAKKFGNKLIDYLPTFFEDHYEGNTQETKQEVSDKENEETKEVNKVTNTTNPKSSLDLGDGVVIDAEVLKTENYQKKMHSLRILSEELKNLVS